MKQWWIALLWLPFSLSAFRFSKLKSSSKLHSKSKKLFLFNQLKSKFHLNKEKCKTLEESFVLFENVTGFIETVQQVLNHKNEASADGHWFEVEKAIMLQKKYASNAESIIVAFSTIVDSDKSKCSREFDIIAYIFEMYHLFECKNISWSYDSSKLKKQLQEQQKIAQELQLPFTLCSKNYIKEPWKSLLQQHNIRFEEDHFSLSSSF